MTALMAASEKGRTDVVGLLIEYNANVNAGKEVRLHLHLKDIDIELEKVV